MKKILCSTYIVGHFATFSLLHTTQATETKVNLDCIRDFGDIRPLGNSTILRFDYMVAYLFVVLLEKRD